MERSEAASPWRPFRHSAFALLWTATLVSNTGTWMHEVGAGWLMTTLSPSPAVVALVQAATTAPIFLFALFAGALADRIDKRRFLITVNALAAIVVGVMAGTTALGLMTQGLLLAFTFLIGTGAAMMAPAWQAVVPLLVPRESLPAAIALNSMGINIARAIGPAAAGVLITSVALSAPFVANALSHLLILVALLVWKPVPVQSLRSLPPEPLLGAMLTAVRHAAHNAALQSTLVRSLGFFSFASAYWALLPLVARGIPGGGPELFGWMMTSVGAGAVAGALGLPKVRRRLNASILAALGTVVTALAMVLLAVATLPAVALGGSLLGGLGWIIVLTSLNVSAQTALPDWIRGRGLAISLMVFFGSMAAGSAAWGQVAAASSIEVALLAAAVGALLAIPLTWRAKLGRGEDLDLTPAMAWADPVLSPTFEGDPDRGPVMVTIEYRIEPADQTGFLAAVRALAGERYRDGAYQWAVMQDAADPWSWTEWFLVPSWAEHLRQHDRATAHDLSLHARTRAFHRGAEPPRVRHLLAPAIDP